MYSVIIWKIVKEKKWRKGDNGNRETEEQKEKIKAAGEGEHSQENKEVR